MNKLPIEFKEKWVAALRSGEYEQAQHALYQDSQSEKGYCCLGVACAVAGYDKEDLIGKSEGGAIRKFKVPEALKQSSVYMSLVKLNDNEGKSFSEIADYIETNL